MEKNTMIKNHGMACMTLYPIIRTRASVLTTTEQEVEEFEGNLALEKSPEIPMPSTPSLIIGPRAAGPLMVEKSYTMEFFEWTEYYWSSSSHQGLLCLLDEDLTQRVGEDVTAYQAGGTFPVSSKTLTRSNFAIIHSAHSATQLTDDLYDFCIRYDLSACLSVALGLLRDSFPSVKRLRLQLEKDPDISEEWILIDFDVQGEGEDILDQYDRYTERWVRSVPWPQRDKIRVSFNIE